MFSRGLVHQVNGISRRKIIFFSDHTSNDTNTIQQNFRAWWSLSLPGMISHVTKHYEATRTSSDHRHLNEWAAGSDESWEPCAILGGAVTFARESRAEISFWLWPDNPGVSCIISSKSVASQSSRSCQNLFVFCMLPHTGHMSHDSDLTQNITNVS